MTTRALDRYSCVCAALSNRSWRNSSLIIAACIIVLGAFLSGCAGVTSAKGGSTTATNSDTTTSDASGTLSVSPAAVSFGNVAVGSISNQSLSVTNSGSVALTISQVTVTGAGFTVGGASLPLTLSPGNSFTFTASFDPTTAGDVSGSFSIVSPQLNSPLAMSMSGTGMAVAPAITSQPLSQSVLIGQTATFSVTASGTAPLSYQWRKNGTALSSATSSSYTTPAETVSDNGAQFTVVISNMAGSVTSTFATLAVTAAPVAPSITSQPANQTTFAGQTATFSVIASGTVPLNYQWQKNGAAISGAISSNYTTPPEITSDNGAQFTVVISNTAGTIISRAATLTVNPDPVAPSITGQPASQTIAAGQTATFSVTAIGTAPLSYQWQKNGAAIAGATSSSYTTPAETASGNGAQFSVVVSNSAGTVTSNAAILTVNAPPAVTAQPVNQTVAVGQTATFSVTATGTAPLSYQWRKNGANISGATASAYTTPATVSTDNGAQFSVVISNVAGSVTSSTATLTVNVPPTITTQPSSVTITAGQTATFSVTATGTAPLSYQWKKNGTSITGATAASYTTPAETTADNGAQFTVVVSNSVGSVTSNAATLTVNPAPVAPSITTQPSSVTITAGQTATFSVTATGTAPLSYQWSQNGTPSAERLLRATPRPPKQLPPAARSSPSLVSNSVGSVTSNAATLTVNPAPVAPSITTQPSSVTITAGQTATFSVTATGTAPLSYQWKKNGTSITGATAASYTTPAETTADNGAQFTVVVSNSVGSVTSSAATLTVNPAPVAPSITTQPSSVTITAGQTATFSVTATGTAPLSYQWKKNGTSITGATAASYTTPAETTADNGAQFTVVVSNSVGSVTSSAATLTVNTAPVAPSITTQPSSVTITAGQTATFSVTATGTAPLSYQWSQNGTAISGATSSSYTTPAETTSASGAQFTALVSNSVGSVTSNAATLTVNPAPVAPSITTQPSSVTIAAGQTATFSVTATGTAPLSYQWSQNGTAISGATSSSYTTPAETTSASGAQFTALVSNSVGSVTSNAATLTVNPAPVAPSITTQPSSVTITAGQTATFSVTATGTAPLSYQWSQNGTAISGATSSSYTTPAETTSASGAQFTALVSNSVGSVTSNAATLTVNPAPVAPSITTQPSSVTITAGQTATFSVTATGTAPLSYQWSQNGTAISGATSSSYTTPAETTSASGAQFTALVSNSVGSVTSNAATLTVNPAPVAPSITTQPSSVTITAGQTATFSVTATGTAPLSYQWKKNGTSISGATAASYTTPAETTADNGAQFTVVVSNSVGNVTSSAATLTVNPAPVAPSITTQPSSVTITAGQTATFSVTATGTAPLSYQWSQNGTAISGATSSTYTTPAETTSASGAQFTVVVSNSVGSVTSSAATLTVNPAPVAPSITTQPSSVTITAGQTATFSVTATGTAPLSYQWKKNGTSITGATAASYTTPAETTADNGAQFTVLVSNSAGNVTSNAATLTVNALPPGALTPSTTSLNFSNVNVGSNSPLGVTLTNSGSTNITVSNVTISGAGFTASGVSNGQIITPAQVVTLNVTFTPAATGGVTGSVTVTSNASNSPVSISLSGTGVQAHSATLNWTASTSTVIGYDVYRGTVSGGPYTLLNPSPVAATQYVDSTVAAGQTYYYVVTAVASGNVQSADSNQVSAAIPTP